MLEWWAVHKNSYLWNKIICQIALNPTFITISFSAKPEHYQKPSGEPNFPTSTLAFPAPAEHDNMGEARSVPLLRNDCSLAAGTTFWQRTNSRKFRGLRNRLGEISEWFSATSEACRRVRETRWRRIDHLLTAGARLNARTSEKGARAHPNCAVPTLDAAHRKCKHGSNGIYAKS